MTLTFVTNIVNHHQLPVADEFYRILGENYHFISTEPVPDWLVKGGYDPSLNRPYIIRTYESELNRQSALQLINSADIVIMGAGPIEWVLERKKKNQITFHYSERWIKKIDFHAISYKRLRSVYEHYWRFRNRRCYMLCASAFTATDMRFYHIFPDKCFKWGYFTSVEAFDYDFFHKQKEKSKVIQIMWCARFLDWKHPELPVLLAEKLKNAGYNFVVDMFGGGELFNDIKTVILQKDLCNYVKLRGNLPNALVIEEMRKHDIFLFTSDRGEGWGAVANEAMSNGCALVASNKIGSVPYLIQDGINGLMFKSGSLKSLEKKVIQLLDNPILIDTISKGALKTMREIWSPQEAVVRFMNLANSIIQDKLDSYDVYDGPASWA